MSKFKRALVYVLTVMIAIPASLLISATSTARAANADIIIDNGDAGYSTTGTWVSKVSPPDNISGYGSDADVENDSTNTKTARWTPTITSPGTYSIFVHYSVGSGRPTNVPYTISYNGGTTVVPVDQTKDSGGITPLAGAQIPSGWIALGSYNLVNGNYVQLQERATGNTCADAVRFVHINDIPTVPALSAPADGISIEAFSGDQLLSAVDSTDSDGDALQYQAKYDGVDSALLPTPFYRVPIVLGGHTWQFRSFDGTDYSTWSAERNFSFVDTTSPVITINPSNPMTLDVGAAYVEPGATAHDSYRGNLTSAITIDNSAVNTAVPGPYTVTYDVSDGINPAHAERTVNVVDLSAPVISAPWLTPDPATTGDEVVIRANVTDNLAVASVRISVNGGMFNLMDNAGSYQFGYNVPQSLDAISYTIKATDTTGHESTRSGIIDPSDNDVPVITSVAGSAGTTGDPSLVTVSATDNIALSRAEISVNGSAWIPMVGTGSPFTYNVILPSNTTAATYYSVNVYDSVNNVTSSGPHFITVTDNDAPVISLNGASDITVEVQGVYTEQGASVSDNCDSGLTATIFGTVDTSVVGDYTVYYDAMDSSTNAAVQVTRTVHVVDTTKPVITLNGSSDITLEVHTAYVEQGAVASDNYDSDFAATISGTVNVDLLGNYVVTYSATDANNNHAVQVTRTVHVVDTTKPVITLVGENPQVVELNSAYVELGATALDNYDGDITANIQINSADVYTAEVGEYLVSYNVLDVANNAAVEVLRTVKVVDSRPAINGEDATSITSDSVAITWTTDYDSTSRVVYDIESHPILGSGANYGYAYSTVEVTDLVKSHKIVISGLNPGQTYYFRTISHGSPERISDQGSFTTAAIVTAAPVAGPTAPVRVKASTSSSVTTAPNTSDTTVTPDEQGKIKGDETAKDESETINWTPWIILFILILLAGAATGGYFYWFGKEDDEKTQVVVKKAEPATPAPKAEVKQPAKKPAASNKKSRRW